MQQAGRLSGVGRCAGCWLTAARGVRRRRCCTKLDLVAARAMLLNLNYIVLVPVLLTAVVPVLLTAVDYLARYSSCKEYRYYYT